MFARSVAKSMRAMLAAVLLLLAPVSVLAISDIGRPEVTRLYDTDSFACTGSYIFPYIDEHRSWIVTAGHCTIAGSVRRNGSTTSIGVVNWRGQITNNHPDGYIDIAVGTAPDLRDNKKPHFWIGDDPKFGDDIYIHGFPGGVESVTRGRVLDKSVLERVMIRVPQMFGGWSVEPASKYNRAHPILVKKGTIAGGSSGSPVLDPHDRVVGILWGMLPAEMVESGVPDGHELVFYTPISQVKLLMDLMGVKQ